MRFDKVFLVFRKDWTDIKRNWQILLPIIIIPIIFSIFLPIIILIPSLSITPSTSLESIKSLIEHLPYHVKNQIIEMNDQQALT